MNLGLLALLALLVGSFVAVAVSGVVLGPLALLVGFVLVITLIVVLVRDLFRLWRS